VTPYRSSVKGYQKLLRWAEEFRLLSGQAEVQDGELAGGEELAAQIGKAVVAEDDEHCGLAGMLLELSVVDIKILQNLDGAFAPGFGRCHDTWPQRMT
jgi:hypothetical protein